MDAVMIDAMIVEAVRAERERIRKRLEAVIKRGFWSQLVTVEQELLKCVDEGREG
jgi:hypothetical protein